MKTTRLRNARLIDGTLCDLMFNNMMMEPSDAAVDEDIDLEGNVFVSSGWIDLHTHCFKKFKLYGDDIDTIGIQSGVTSIVDAGTAGSDTVDEFYQQAQCAKTNVFSFLNIAKTGINAQNELADLTQLNEQAIADVLHRYPDFVVGLKARMSRSVLQNSGNQPLDFARYIADQYHIPIMVHIGNEPAILEDVLDRLHSGDIVTHIFNPKKNGILTETGEIKPAVWDAHKKGVLFDIGHGTESFCFHTCEIAFQNHLLSDTISTDIYYHNREHGPVYSLAHTMSKLYQIGYTLQQCIDQVTKIPAQILHHEELGVIRPGTPADLTLFQIKNTSITGVDAVQDERKMNAIFQPIAVVKDGEFYNIKGDGLHGSGCL